MAYQHGGFWACMDTFKEKQDLEELFTPVSYTHLDVYKRQGKHYLESR